jgi:hypothetical protein
VQKWQTDSLTCQFTVYTRLLRAGAPAATVSVCRYVQLVEEILEHADSVALLEFFAPESIKLVAV